MKEQYQRFCAVARARFDCDDCPIRNECFDYSDSLTPEEQKTAPRCEELLFQYIMANKTPSV